MSYEYNGLKPAEPRSVPPAGTMMGFKDIVPFFSELTDIPCQLWVRLKEDGSLRLDFCNEVKWQRVLVFALPAPIDHDALGLLIRTFRRYQPPYNILNIDAGIRMPLMSKDIEGDLDNLLEIRRSRGRHEGIERAVDLLEPAARSLSRHREIELYRHKHFRILTD